MPLDGTGKPRRGRKGTPEMQWSAFLMHRAAGQNTAEAARNAGISYSTVMRAQRSTNPSEFGEYRRAKRRFDEDNPKEAVDTADLPADAQRALEDFAYFRLRYFGIVSTPWQVHAAEQIVQLLDTDREEYVVINVPPGAGKSTLFTFHIPCWLICRNRAVRIMIGSATERTAKMYGGRLRRALERTEPIKNPTDAVAAGHMVDARACLVADFGRFKPVERDLWRAEEFRVEQTNGAPTEEKEATVATYGRDGGFLGGRFDFVIWDDLVTKKNQRVTDSREAMQEWWDDEAETRLEPGGLLVLQGQRLQSNDLYRYALDKPDHVDEDTDPSEAPRKFKHIIYKAHYPEHCNGDHKRDAAFYDPHQADTTGCLLDPRRLSWRKLEQVKANRLEGFLVVYQQEDLDPASVLVNKLWVSGGRDPETGEEYPGCWDHDRSIGRIPSGLSKPWLCVVSADPSPTKFWSVQMWLYHPATEQRFLIDHERKAMDAPDFLDYDSNTDTYVGILESWWQSAQRAGAPFSHVIVEQNAAQRFLLQYRHVKAWMALRGVAIVGHDTYGSNKSDATFGVETLAPHWKFGRVRLPGNSKDGSRLKAMYLVNEVTNYPESSTTDCVMAEWFFEYTLQRQLRRQLLRPTNPPKFTRPSWLGRTA